MSERPIAVLYRGEVPNERLESYLEAVRNAGGQAIAITPDEDARAADRAAEYAGLMLTGGADVDPAIYRSAPHEKTRFTDPIRDGYELRFITGALELDLPVLAICRGHQLLNVALGGGLHQHIEDYSHVSERETGESRWHEAELTAGTRLRALHGDAARIRVNSRHHQAVTPALLAPGLVAAALTADGYVEGAESAAHRFVVGVQWHPERDEMRELSAGLFRAFVEAARIS